MEVKCSSLARVNTVNEISSLLNDSTKILGSIAKSLGWDNELSPLRSQEEVTSAECPVDKNHIMKSNHLKKHTGKCRLKKLGVDLNKDVVQSSCFFYKSSPEVVSVLSSEDELHMELPADIQQFIQSPEKRLQSYDKIVEITRCKRKVKQESFEDDTDMAEDSSKGDKQQKSKLEMLAEKRDYKRRRQSYRAKNVHITKRTPTDIMREIIENRMEELRKLQEENHSSQPRLEHTKE